MFSIFDGQKRGIGLEDGADRDIFMRTDVEFRRYLHHFKGAKLAVFQAIILHADKYGWAEPPISLLEEETGYQPGTISSAITELCKTQISGQRVMLAIQERNKGKFVKNRYLIFPTIEELTRHECSLRKPRTVHKKPYTVKPSTEKPNSENRVDSINQSEEDPIPETSSFHSEVSQAPSQATTPVAPEPTRDVDLTSTSGDVPESSQVADERKMSDPQSSIGSQSTPPPTPSPLPDWWTNDAFREKRFAEGQAEFTSRGISQQDAARAIERLSNGSLKKWWEKWAWPGGSQDFLLDCGKEARKIVAERVFQERMADQLTAPVAVPDTPVATTNTVAFQRGDPVWHSYRQSGYGVQPVSLAAIVVSVGKKVKIAYPHADGHVTTKQVAASTLRTRYRDGAVETWERDALEPAKRPPNLAFDAIAKYVFKLDKTPNGGAIGKMINSIKDCVDEKYHATLGEDLTNAFAWWTSKPVPNSPNGETYNAPGTALKICRMLTDWREAGSPSRASPDTPVWGQVPDPDNPGFYKFGWVVKESA